MRNRLIHCVLALAFLAVSLYANSQIPYYNNYVIDHNTYIKVCFTGTHTYVSDLGFYLVARTPSNQFHTVKLMPSLSLAWSGDVDYVDGVAIEYFGCLDFPPDENSVCNGGNNFDNFCFATHNIIGGFSINYLNFESACVCDLGAPLDSLVASAGPWNPVYGLNPSEVNWFFQIRDCELVDVGMVSFVELQIGFTNECYNHFRKWTFQTPQQIPDNVCSFEEAPLFYLNQISDSIVYYSGIPEICEVETSAANYNVLSWVKDYNNQFIDHYIIYRKQEPNGSYFELSQSDYDQEPIFFDGTAQPHIYSYRYKISVVDICGNEIECAFSHKTFLLNYTTETEGVWNLSWQNYEGVDYSEIEIYRGTNPDEMELLTTVPASATAYTDNQAPVGSYVYYQLKIVNPNTCNSQKIEGEIVSNIATNDEGYYLNQTTPLFQPQFTLSPNPAHNSVNISFTAPNAKLSICDLNGETLIVKNDFTGGEINIENLKAGVYVVKLETDSGIAIRKLIVE
ncbi:MAG TPA: T9SS type A sorting domain-containing protein [Bacteroidales bacterium]|nr:T9SS type A sorting domain-containing protein [Bacteroidales bacterium]